MPIMVSQRIRIEATSGLVVSDQTNKNLTERDAFEQIQAAGVKESMDDILDFLADGGSYVFYVKGDPKLMVLIRYFWHGHRLNGENPDKWLKGLNRSEKYKPNA